MSCIRGQLKNASRCTGVATSSLPSFGSERLALSRKTTEDIALVVEEQAIGAGARTKRVSKGYMGWVNCNYLCHVCALSPAGKNVLVPRQWQTTCRNNFESLGVHRGFT